MIKIDFVNWISDVRTISTGILLLIFVHMNTAELIPYSNSFGLKFSPWIFPFIMSTRIVRAVLYFLLLFLICDIGKSKSIDLLIRLRVAPLYVKLSQLATIFYRTSLYWLFIFFSPIIMYLPHIEWTTRWGKIFGHLSREAEYEALGDFAIRISSKIVDGYTPVKATALSFLLAVLSSCLLGLIVLLSTDFISNYCGIFISSAFVLMDFWVETDALALPYLIKVSFCTYSHLGYMSIGALKRNNISAIYAFSFILILILFLSFIHIQSRCVYVLKLHKKGVL